MSLQNVGTKKVCQETFTLFLSVYSYLSYAGDWGGIGSVKVLETISKTYYHRMLFLEQLSEDHAVAGPRRHRT